jgi:hypothetical protein
MKQLEHKTEESPPSVAEVKNIRSFSYMPIISYHNIVASAHGKCYSFTSASNKDKTLENVIHKCRI